MVLLFFPLRCMCMLHTFGIYHTFNTRKKENDVCPNLAPFLHPIPIPLLSWQKWGQGPSSQFLSVSERARGIEEAGASPPQLGPGYSRVRRPEEGRARAGSAVPANFGD